MSKYDPLLDELSTGDPGARTMTFAAIDRLVGGLPTSARRHRAWWANDTGGRHVQAAAWIDAGRTVAAVDLDAQTVTFGRRHGA